MRTGTKEMILRPQNQFLYSLEGEKGGQETPSLQTKPDYQYAGNKTRHPSRPGNPDRLGGRTAPLPNNTKLEQLSQGIQ